MFDNNVHNEIFFPLFYYCTVLNTKISFIALFLLAHKLVDLYPESALAWFAVGCYYYLIGKCSELSHWNISLLSKKLWLNTVLLYFTDTDIICVFCICWEEFVQLVLFFSPLKGKNEQARRYLSKATALDRVFGPAWIAYGHSFAAENEHDQAMAAYYKAAQLMKGCHLPLLYIGMEYGLTNNPKFAEKFFKEALEIAPTDPFVLHEIGVVAFSNQE